MSLPAPVQPLASKLPPPSLLRAELESAVLRDLLGPAGGEEEEVAEGRVRDRYLAGVLAPRHQPVEPEAMDELDLHDESAEDGIAEGALSGAPGLFPSSIGLSFCVDGSVRALRVTAKWGRYERCRAGAPGEDGKAGMVWKRIPMSGTVDLPLAEGAIEARPLHEEQPDVFVQGLARNYLGDLIVTLFLVNGQEEPSRTKDEAWIFQPELAVTSPDGAPIFLNRPLQHADRLDPVARAELQDYSLLYRDRVEFAGGHGVAVQATPLTADPSRAVRVATNVVPCHEVALQTPPDAKDEPLLKGLLLDMKVLAETEAKNLASRLQALPSAYADWIARQKGRLARCEDRLQGHEEAGERALVACEATLERIRDGIRLLGEDPVAAEAFRFANRAMWLQRVHSLLSEARRRGKDVDIEDLDLPENRTWRVFQLAFILQCLPGIARLDHPDRVEPTHATADLLWYPTGGGKTEAYLGLTAFTLGLRRLQGPVEGRPAEYGVAVLMRYTLRLLTLQQFQRATALICACEFIRRKAREQGDDRWGSEPFRIGLWVGMKTTPNRTDQSAESLQEERGQYKAGKVSVWGSPAQLTNCPWCGSPILPGKHIQVDPYSSGTGRTLLYCGDALGNCPFTERLAKREGIPAMVVDEEIYRRLPSLLISTVDKFAQMPWNGAVAALFGQVSGRCTRHGFRTPDLEDADSHPPRGDLERARTLPVGPLRPPDLIIQDELHLISGPLGSLTGLYETAVDDLCTWEVGGRKVRPKVIASTATIRRAPEQVRALFLRDVAVFPPNGLDAADNFFARERDPALVPGRRYLGICAPGRRVKAAMIRVYVAFLAAAWQIYERYGAAADPWLTLVGYFNSMRELAGMRRLVEDDVRSRLRETDKRGLAKRRAPIVEELTSRKRSSEIPLLLDRLEVGFDPAAEARREEARKAGKRLDQPMPLDVLLATSMISVGVDVKRFGLMVVGGQPKTTAEYIQATSRVGRHVAGPGLVATVYNWSRPRDLSHYERFGHYHARFHENVEALSVTPFAPRALDRGLSGILVALVRLAGMEFNSNEGAEQVRGDLDVVEHALTRIRQRAEDVSGSRTLGEDVERAVRTRLDEWVRQATRKTPTHLGYKLARDGKTRGLLWSPEKGDWRLFTCLNSLRDVEPTVPLILVEGGLDEEAVSPPLEAP